MILEPCCKIKQFSQFLGELKRKSSDSFTYYGDVHFQDWFTLLLLEAKGSDAYMRFHTLDITTLNHILYWMRNPAFIPGQNLNMLNRVVIQAYVVCDPLPSVAEILQEEGRLKILRAKRATKSEAISLTPPAQAPRFKLEGTFFAEEVNTPRTVSVKVKTCGT